MPRCIVTYETYTYICPCILGVNFLLYMSHKDDAIKKVHFFPKKLFQLSRKASSFRVQKK